LNSERCEYQSSHSYASRYDNNNKHNIVQEEDKEISETDNDDIIKQNKMRRLNIHLKRKRAIDVDNDNQDNIDVDYNSIHIENMQDADNAVERLQSTDSMYTSSQSIQNA
jgi:hypothetical protein